MRHDKPSLRLAPDGEAMEERAPAHTNGSWELHIINHLISHCGIGGLEQTDEDTGSGFEETDEDTGSGFEESDLGDAEAEPVPVGISKKEKRRRKQGERKHAGNVLLQWCNDMAH